MGQHITTSNEGKGASYFTAFNLPAEEESPRRKKPRTCAPPGRAANKADQWSPRAILSSEEKHARK